MTGSGFRRMTAGIAAAGALGMLGLSFAAVPLYRLFCEVTGYGGTPRVAQTDTGQMLERTIVIRFDANVDPGLAWTFQPVQREMTLRVGEPGLAFYRAHNPTGQTLAGVATFNVTPLKAGAYFNKTQCFCFQDQRLEPGHSADMPVAFFVDPAIADNRNLDDVRAITLSYTFFQTKIAGATQTVAVPAMISSDAISRRE
jgi:cytochrome c oxidase assembly protein subunit 11